MLFVKITCTFGASFIIILTSAAYIVSRTLKARVHHMPENAGPAPNYKASANLLFVYSRRQKLHGYEFLETKKCCGRGRVHELTVRLGEAVLFRMAWMYRGFDNYFSPHFSIDAGDHAASEQKAAFKQKL